MINVLLNIGAYGFAFCFFSKIILHMYLDDVNGRKVILGPANFLPFYYFLPYFEEVDVQYEKWKWICNFLYRLSIATFLFIVFTALVKKLVIA